MPKRRWQDEDNRTRHKKCQRSHDVIRTDNKHNDTSNLLKSYNSKAAVGMAPDSSDIQLTQQPRPVDCDSLTLCLTQKSRTLDPTSLSLWNHDKSPTSPSMCNVSKSRPVTPDSPDLCDTPQPTQLSPDNTKQTSHVVEPESPYLCLTQQPQLDVPSSPDMCVTQDDSLFENDSFLAELDDVEISFHTPKPKWQLAGASQTSCEPNCSSALKHSLQKVNHLNSTSGFESDCSMFAESGVDYHDGNVATSSVQLDACERNTKFSSVGISTNQALRHTTPLNALSLMDKSAPSPLSMSFHEKLKSRLMQNSKQLIVPNDNKARHQREEMVQQALREAVILKENVLSQPGIKTECGNFYGLSDKVKELLNRHRGITKLYDWQHECLSLPALKTHSNLIYSLPTSGGKTLVAEILIFQEILLRQKDVIFILPFVSIVQEKVRELSPFAVDLNFLVEEYAASKGCFPPKKRRQRKTVFICTIEKANSLVNSLIEHGRIDSIGLTVVDELHMLGEGGSRGSMLEMTLTKLMHTSPATQLVGMSATLNNIKDLQTFLHAELYANNFRPVELKEYVKVEDMIYEIDHNALSPDDKLKHHSVISFKYTSSQLKLDPDHIGALVLEVIPKHSCLVFCPTKKNCENVAELVCQFTSKKMLKEKQQERRALIEALLFDGNGQICPVLKRTVPYGIAYHHSGLTMDERKLIEEAYSEGTLCMLACTSTLAAGVNLPARRVILRSPYIASQFLTSSQYKQMTGRAGRAGIDTSGESIVIVQNRDRSKILDLVSGPCESCRSSLLYQNKKGISSLLLTTIGLQITRTTQSVIEFLRKTLCYVQRGYFDLDLIVMANEGLQHLVDLRLVKQFKSGSEDNLEVTKLGKAVVKGSIDLDLGPRLYEDLQESRMSLVLANHLHLLYLVTPYDLAEVVKPDWMIYLHELGTFDGGELKVCSLIGITESYIARNISGQKIRKPIEERIVKRFYLTLMLYNLWKQRSIWYVATKFNQTRGFVQQLLNSTASFASCVNHFCQELDELWAYQDLLGNFVKHLSYCVSMELIPLLEIPGVKIGRARQLYTAGYKSVQLLAYADPEKLVKDIEHMPRKAANQIVASAQMLLQQQAEALLEEADDLLAMPLTVTQQVTPDTDMKRDEMTNVS